MEFLPAQADTLNDILRWRRDVRHFRTDPVAEPVIDRLRGAMDMAPSVGNSRPWRVLRGLCQVVLSGRDHESRADQAAISAA
ncbi:MAG: nitroreductase family protein [Burkholderiaceae bacterium]|nr:nitroreductase family protein [Burkholderiaceae bacterium]